ncbi:hypothetical protein V8E55_004868 [Tylopilus felleus]
MMDASVKSVSRVRYPWPIRASIHLRRLYVFSLYVLSIRLKTKGHGSFSSDAPVVKSQLLPSVTVHRRRRKSCGGFRVLVRIAVGAPQRVIELSGGGDLRATGISLLMLSSYQNWNDDMIKESQNASAEKKLHAVLPGKVDAGDYVKLVGRAAGHRLQCRTDVESCLHPNAALGQEQERVVVASMRLGFGVDKVLGERDKASPSIPKRRPLIRVYTCLEMSISAWDKQQLNRPRSGGTSSSRKTENLEREPTTAAIDAPSLDHQFTEGALSERGRGLNKALRCYTLWQDVTFIRWSSGSCQGIQTKV